jgi:hypothetical protein
VQDEIAVTFSREHLTAFILWMMQMKKKKRYSILPFEWMAYPIRRREKRRVTSVVTFKSRIDTFAWAVIALMCKEHLNTKNVTMASKSRCD